MANHLQPDLNTAVIVNGSLCRQTEAQMAGIEPRVNGSGSFTIAGTEALGDVLTLTLTSKIFTGGSHAVAVTSVAGDTDASLADRFAQAINADALLQSFGVSGAADPVTSGKVDITWPGPLGGYVTLSAATTGLETFSYVQIAGGSGPIIPIDNFQFVNNGAIIPLVQNRRKQLDAVTLGALVAAGPQVLDKNNPSTVTFPCQ